MKKHYQVSELPKIPGLREMRREDVSQVRELLSSYLERFDVAQMFSKDEEVEHWFLSGQGREENGKRVEQVVWAYVVEVSLLESVHLSLHPLCFLSLLPYFRTIL
jgi:glycylpeptide N-tetradecanoyltransferase